MQLVTQMLAGGPVDLEADNPAGQAKRLQAEISSVR